MKILGVIPARFDSSRFPGKPLILIEGKSMIQRVYEQCIQTKFLDEVLVATDDERIFDTVQTFGGNVLMTSTQHLNGTSRCFEAYQKIKTNQYKSFDFIINIQGDEPYIQPQQIDELCQLFSSKEIEIVTQVKQETSLELLNNQNIVKAILDENNFVLDFTRENPSINPSNYFYKHIGIYGFRADVLAQITQFQPTKNEHERRLEQMRWLDNNYSIKAGITTFDSISIDAPEDVERALLLKSKLTHHLK